MGLAYLLLVVFLILFCAYRSTTFDDYSKYFGLFGTLVGVATGAIPGYFFKTQADKANNLADKATDHAHKESAKAQLYAGALAPEKAEEVKRGNLDVFS